MANDSVSVSGPVKIQSDGPSRVAFDLMIKIGSAEAEKQGANREYWLTLYCQCLKATTGQNLKRTLERD